ncbi:MAG: hypothetical protein R3F28_05220 [Candidatus Kapaibacterium sp.]
MSAPEDKRQAAGMAIGVSNQVMAASLAMLAILGAVFIFIMDKRSITPVGLLFVSGSFLLFVVSVFAGAKGVAAVYKRGHNGDWHYRNGDTSFQIQALTAVIGVLLFPIGIALMEKPAESLNAAPHLQHSVDSLSSVVSQNNLQLRDLIHTVDSLKEELAGR